jgi:hypothetical protein
MKRATLIKAVLGSASVLALAVAAPSFAAPISDDAIGNGGGGAFTGTGAGNFFLTVEDVTLGSAFIENLGRNVLNDVTTPTSWSSTDAAANSALAAFIAAHPTDTFQWNVAGITNSIGGGSAPYTKFGFVTTNAGQTTFGAGGFGPFLAGMSNIGSYLFDVNATGSLASSNFFTINKPASLAGSAYPTAPEYNGNFSWMSIDNRTTGFTGSAQFAYVYSPDDPANTTGAAAVIQQLGTIAINAATGVVAFTVGGGGGPPVPLPGAIWLLGSALLGLGGVSRRKLAATA